jgi:replicative DNA helicase
MVFLEDNDKKISRELLKSILKVELAEYDEKKFIKPKLSAWILINRLKGATNDIIDESRTLDGVQDLEQAMISVSKIKEITNVATTINFDSDDDIGTDFDDAEEHTQDHSQLKVKTGWDTLDTVLGGGWDISTFNVIMGETNSGKCFLDETLIYVKNKKTSKIGKVKIEDFFDKIKNA